jgi:uncharacterized protein YdiU (UPF0061 family)
MMAAKFGLASLAEQDSELIAQAFELMQRAEMDMTGFFRGLAVLDLEAPSLVPLRAAFYREDLLQRYETGLQSWLERYAARLRQDGEPTESRRARMNAVNPRFVLRNYLAQQAIDRAEAGDAALVLELLEVMRHPYAEQPEWMKFAEKRPDWAREKAGCCMLSCSS